MLSETFRNPKPILGKLQLLALPGAPGWDGQLEALVTRAEQEATALATGGVDGLLIENTDDAPYGAGRLDPAGAIALALVARRVKSLTGLPIGLSVLRNDPQTALAVALNVEAAFIRLPLVSGALLTESGMMAGKLDALMHYKNRLRMASLPLLLVDVSADHQIPGISMRNESMAGHLAMVSRETARHPAVGGLIFSDFERSQSNPDEADLDILNAIRSESRLPILVENRTEVPTDGLMHWYDAADGLILDAGTRKTASLHPGRRPTIDLPRVEALVNRLHGIKPLSEMDPAHFLSHS